MPQLLPLSRAARLVGVSRGELQSRIQRNELVTFEGMIRISDLLRVFPETRLQDDSAIERAERIKAMATPNTEVMPKLPSAKVLASRVTGLSKELTESRSEVSHYAGIIRELDERLARVEKLEAEKLASEIRSIHAWLQAEYSQLPKVPKRKTELMARETFLRMVEARVKLIPSGHEYFVEGADTLLESGLRSGYALRYGCTRGSCSKCKARVVSGEVLRVRDHEYQITETERNLGYILMCSYTAVTDLVIEADEARSSHDIPIQNIVTKVKKLDKLDEDTVILYLTTASTSSLRFLAGQTVQLTLPSGQSLTLPVASCPCDGSQLEFHIHRHPGSEFVKQVLDEGLEKNIEVGLSGPTGDFVLQVDSERPILFIAYGEGFAVIKSLIESALAADSASSYHIYWLTPGEAMPYLHNRCRTWGDALSNFEYTPVAMGITGSETKTRKYFEQVIEELPDIKNYDVYVAAPSGMIEAIGELMRDSGLNDRHFAAFEIDSAPIESD